MRTLYRCLLWLHPARFHARFGAEMLFGFDAARSCGGRLWLAADGLVSLFRQWAAAMAARPLGRKSRLWTMAKDFASVLLFVWLLTSHVAQATTVPTPSMSPAVLPGDHMIVDKLGFPASVPQPLRSFVPLREIHRGDIIVFRWPVDPGISFVKRVIGLPGDRLEIRGKDVYVNGVKLVETYKELRDQSDNAFQPRDNYGPVVVPPASYFVMGDNRDNSLDSRFWGFVPQNDIEGRPLFIYWSYEPVPVDSSMQSTWRDKAGSVVSSVVNLFAKTRWSRTGALVH